MLSDIYNKLIEPTFDCCCSVHCDALKKKTRNTLYVLVFLTSRLIMREAELGICELGIREICHYKVEQQVYEQVVLFVYS